MSKIIKAVFTGRFCKTQRVFQWDTDDKLQFVNVDLPANYTVDFSNSKTGDSVSVLATSDTVQIPPDLFVPGSEIYAWIWLSDSNGGHTRCEATIPIDPRARRTGAEPTPAQTSAWDEAVDTLNETIEGIPAVINSALTEAKESGEFDGADGAPGTPGSNGASAYELAVEHGYTGTEAEWLNSLHGADAVVDPTLSNPGEAADAAETGKVAHTADYALTFAETLNSGAGIPLDSEWERGGINSYGSNDSRKYRARTVGTVQAPVAVTVKAASGYQFFAVRYNPDGTRIGVTDWLTSRELPVGESWRICVRAYPEDTSVTADPDVFGAAITIQNNIGSGGGGGSGVTVDDALSGSSTNPVQNKVVKAALDGKGTYSKPAPGIPKTDLAEDVQTSLGKADTALQSAPVSSVNGQIGAVSLSIPTVPSNVSAFTNDAGYLTQHQDISGKADKVTEVTVSTSGAVTQELDAGKVYHFTGSLTALTLTLNAAAAGQQAQYHFDFLSGATAPTVTIPATVTMPDGWTVEANTRYELDILDGYGVAQSWEVTS